MHTIDNVVAYMQVPCVYHTLEPEDLLLLPPPVRWEPQDSAPETALRELAVVEAEAPGTVDSEAAAHAPALNEPDAAGVKTLARDAEGVLCMRCFSMMSCCPE